MPRRTCTKCKKSKPGTLKFFRRNDECHGRLNTVCLECERAVEVLNKMHASGRVTDDGVKKLDAIPRSKAAPIAPEFAQLYETFASASAAVAGINDPAMRLAVAKATLDEVIRKAERVKDELAK
jgi:predicted DNA binding protein